MVAPLESSYGQHFGIPQCTTTLPPHRDTFGMHWRVESKLQPIFSILISKACSTPSSVSRIGPMDMLHGRRKHERVLDVSARWVVYAHWWPRAEYHTFTMYVAFYHIFPQSTPFVLRSIMLKVFFAINPGARSSGMCALQQWCVCSTAQSLKSGRNFMVTWQEICNCWQEAGVYIK